MTREQIAEAILGAAGMTLGEFPPRLQAAILHASHGIIDALAGDPLPPHTAREMDEAEADLRRR